MIRSPEARKATGLAKSTFYLRIREGLLPRPVSLGRRLVGWPESEIAAVNAARIAGKSDTEIRELVKQLEAGRAETCAASGDVIQNKARVVDALTSATHLPSTR